MAQALFISVDELKKNSIIEGNVDPKKIVYLIKVAQDTHVQNYLGGKLYTKLQNLLINDEMNDAGNSDYKSLWTDYIKEMLIWYSQVEYFTFCSYQISNGGIFKHTSENSEQPTVEEISMLKSRAADIAQHYTRRFIDYMDFNNNLFPEYNETTNGEMYPDKDANYNSFYLG